MNANVADQIKDDRMPITTARANLTELSAVVRLLRRVVILTRRDNDQVALVPAEVGKAVIEAGGPDAAVRKLRD